MAQPKTQTLSNPWELEESQPSSELPAYQKTLPTDGENDLRLFINDLLSPEIVAEGPPPPPRVQNLENKYFNMKPKYQDIWATVAFVIHLLAFLGFAVGGFCNFAFIYSRREELIPPHGTIFKSSGVKGNLLARSDDSDMTLDDLLHAFSKFKHVPTFALAFGFLSTYFYFTMLRKYTKTVVLFSWGTLVAAFCTIPIVFFFNGLFLIGFVWSLFVAFLIYISLYRRHRLNFTIHLLQSVTKVTAMFPGTIFVSSAALICQLVWGLLWLLLFEGLICCFLDFEKIKEENRKESINFINYFGHQELWTPAFIYALFSLIWTSQVIRYVAFSTISGVYSTIYYLASVEPTGEIVLHSRKPTTKSLKRSLTTSFGSIVFGSLIITVVDVILKLLGSKNQGARNNISGFRLFIACCCEQVFRFLKDIVEFLNKYAFVQVATFGKSYVESAKDTWQLIKFRGLDLVINDQLTGAVLGMGALFCGLFTSIFTFGAIVLVYSITDNNSTADPAIEFKAMQLVAMLLIMFALFFGGVQFSVLSGTINAGMATFFVCLAQDPQVFSEKQPELFSKIQQTYTSALLQEFPSSSTRNNNDDFDDDDEEAASTQRRFLSSSDQRGHYVNLG